MAENTKTQHYEEVVKQDLEAIDEEVLNFLKPLLEEYHKTEKREEEDNKKIDARSKEKEDYKNKEKEDLFKNFAEAGIEFELENFKKYSDSYEKKTDYRYDYTLLVDGKKVLNNRMIFNPKNYNVCDIEKEVLETCLEEIASSQQNNKDNLARIDEIKKLGFIDRIKVRKELKNLTKLVKEYSEPSAEIVKKINKAIKQIEEKQTKFSKWLEETKDREIVKDYEPSYSIYSKIEKLSKETKELLLAGYYLDNREQYRNEVPNLDNLYVSYASGNFKENAEKIFTQYARALEIANKEKEGEEFLSLTSLPIKKQVEYYEQAEKVLQNERFHTFIEGKI